MKCLLFYLCFGSVCFAQTFSKSVAFLGAAVPKAAASTVFSENFEGWTNWNRQAVVPCYTNVNNWWVRYTTSSGPGTVVTNYQTAWLTNSTIGNDGTNCLEMIDGTGDFPTACSIQFAAQTECWVYFIIQCQQWSAVNAAFGHLQLLDASSNNVCKVIFTSEAAGVPSPVTVYNGTANATSVGTLSPNTNGAFWLHYKSGSGANGIADVGFNTVATRPTSGNNFIQVTTGDATTAAAFVRLSSGGTPNPTFFDKIRVYPGSTPPPNAP